MQAPAKFFMCDPYQLLATESAGESAGRLVPALIVICLACLALGFFRSLWCTRQAKREIGAWLAIRNLSALKTGRVSIFGPHSNSIFEAALASVSMRYYQVEAVDPAGLHSSMTIAMKLSILSGRVKHLETWSSHLKK